MSLGSWDPDADKAAASIEISVAQLQEFIGWSRNDQLNQLESLLGYRSQSLSGLMHLQSEVWHAPLADLSDDELLHLLRFFAVAESTPGWEAGAQSPVIPIAKTLRQRGNKLERETLLWLREVNSNRYLPYGPLL